MSSSSPTSVFSNTSATTPSDTSSATPSKLDSMTPSMPTTIMPSPESQDEMGNDGKKRKRSLKDNSSEDLQVAKKPKRAIKSFQSEPKTVNVKKRKRGQGDDAAEDHPTKKSSIVDKTFEPQGAVAPRNKRQRDQEVNPTEDTELVKKQKLTIEKLELQLSAAKDELELTKIDLQSAMKEAESTKINLESTKRELKYEIVDRELAEKQLQDAVVQFIPMAEFEQLIHIRYKDLRDAIFFFVRENLVKVYDKDTIPEHIEKRVKKVSRTPASKLLRVSPYAQLLFEALIWDFLCTEFIDNPFKLLGKGDDKIGLILGEIQAGKYGGNMERFSSWRAHTIQLFCDCATDNTRLKNQLLELLGTFIVEGKKNDTKNDLEPALENILELATSIARDIHRFAFRAEVMRKSHPDARHVSQAYDNKWMRIDGSSLHEGDTVELVISPALVKYVRSYDSSVEQMMVLQKARVLHKNEVDCVD
ncbi:hypothetical protein F4774DRAFT_114326 [Daldinia eschscholtzii]|nr:hypothetical protein F4774DRAFT_114326 [Daldinia eschscholtzii]